MTEVQAFVETCKLYCTKPACSDAAPGWGKDMWAAVTIPSTNPSAVNDGRDWVQIGIRSGNDMGKSHRLMAGYPNWADIAWPHVVWTLMPPPRPVVCGRPGGCSEAAGLKEVDELHEVRLQRIHPPSRA